MADEGMLTRTVDGIEGKQLLSPDYYDFEAFRGCAELGLPESMERPVQDVLAGVANPISDSQGEVLERRDPIR
jgi:hypothetical protein